MHDLNLPAIADGQADGQWQTSNDGDAALGNAIAEILTVDFAGGDVTLTASQFRGAMTFVPSNLSATRALILPAVKRALFFVHNKDGSDSITVTKGSTTIAVATGKLGAFYTDGTTDGLVGAILAAGAAAGDVSGPGSSVSGNIGTFSGTTGKVIQDSGAAISTDGTLAANSDAKVPTEKAVKTYLDSLVVNLGNGGKVRAATTANITIATALNNGDTLDGVTLATNDLVLVKDQSSAAQNGVYVVGASPARVAAFDTYDEHPGSIIVVEEGSTNADTLWLCTSNVGGTLNTTAINYNQLILTGTVPTTRTITAGAGLTGGGDLSANRTLAVDKATAAYIQANASDKVLTSDNAWSAADPVTLTDASTISVDMSSFLNAKVTLGGNRTLGAPSNPKNGQSGCIEIIQDGTGSRTLAYHADWLFAGGTDPTLSTAAGAKDLLFYQVMSNGKTFGNLVKAVA